MPIRAVIFDLGGVLVRTEDQTPRRELAERLGITRQELYDLVFDSPSARQASLGTMTAEEHMERVRLISGSCPRGFLDGSWRVLER